MRQYLQLMESVLSFGHEKKDRTGTGTRSLFGAQMRFDLTEGFPLVTTKKVHLRSIIHELLWFIAGETNTRRLKENNVTIWDEWADELGDLGPVYGKQWRDWKGTRTVRGDSPVMNDVMLKQGYVLAGEMKHPITGLTQNVWQKRHDQLKKVINQLKNDPDNRRIIISAWNVDDLDEMALAPCHAFFQFYTRELTFKERHHLVSFTDSEWHVPVVNAAIAGSLDTDDDASMLTWMDANGVPTRGLSCQLYQRSADVFLGVPFNIASYALLTEMIAQQVNMVAEEFVWTGGDTHLYSNHLEQARLQLTRDPHPLPRLKFKRKPESIFDYQFEDFEIKGYVSHDAIKAPVAI